MADTCALLLLFYRSLLTAGLRTVDSQQLGLMQHGLCYVIQLTIKCGFSETDVCPTHLCLLQVHQPPRQQCGRQFLVIRTLGMQFTPQLHPSHIQLHHDKLTEELNASSALQEPVCAALPLPAHLQHRELASSDRVCTYWLHTLQLQRSQERKTRLISSRDPGTGSIKCLWVGFKECMKQHIRAIQLGTT